MSKLPQPFGNPSTYKGHSGVDYGKPEKTPILASGNGRVVWTGYANYRAGHATIVVYDAYPTIEIMYAHQPKNSVRPRAGSRFVTGGYLGEVGNTGRSTGPHLHMEILNGQGAHTYEGIWLYFDKDSVVGQGSTSGGNAKPINPVEPEKKDEDDTMKIFQTPENQTFFFATPRGIVAIQNPSHLELLRSFIKSKPGEEASFTPGERDIINDYLTKPVLSWADLNK